MIRRPPRSTLSSSSAASDVYKRQLPLLLLRPGRGTEYCDDWLSVCLSIREQYLYGSERHQFFMLVTCCRGSVFLWWRGDILYASGFMDDVMFAHNCQTQATRKMRILKVNPRAPDLERSTCIALFYFCAFSYKNDSTQCNLKQHFNDILRRFYTLFKIYGHCNMVKLRYRKHRQYFTTLTVMQ